MNFAKLMLESNITQVALAKELNVSQPLISQWVSGKCTPDPTMIILIAKVLKYPMDDILNCFNKKAAK